MDGQMLTNDRVPPFNPCPPGSEMGVGGMVQLMSESINLVIGTLFLVLSLVAYLWRRKRGVNSSLIFLALGVSFVGLAIVTNTIRDWSQWRVILSFVPAFMIAAQAFTMFRRAEWVVPNELENVKMHLVRQNLRVLVPLVGVLDKSRKQLFDSPLIVARLLLPAVFVYSLCSLESGFLVKQTYSQLGLPICSADGGVVDPAGLVRFSKSAVFAADYGLAGAYLFVTVHLALRS